MALQQQDPSLKKVAAVPSDQKLTYIPPTIFNPSFASKAQSLLPTLHARLDTPQHVVTFGPDPNAYFGISPTIHPISSFHTRLFGRDDEVILDFGSHRVGYLSFSVVGEGINVDAPVRLRLTFGEVPLDVAERLHPCYTWISSSFIPEETMTVEWLPQRVEMHRRFAFRYLRVEVLDTSPKFKVRFEDVVVKAVSAVDFNATVPQLDTQDQLLRRIDEVAITTLRDCMQTVFEDGPRRDQRLWLGDLRLQALTNYVTFKDFNLVKRCLYMFAAVVREDGSVPGCVFEKPVLRPASDYIVDYDAFFGATVRDYVVASGDVETGKELWKTVLGTMNVPLSYVSPDGEFKSSRGPHWLFCDWEETLDKNASEHAIILYCAKAVNQLAGILFPGEKAPFGEVVEKMTRCAMRFVHGERGAELAVSGPEKQVSWSSAAWLCLSGALDQEVAQRVLQNTLACPTAVKPKTPYAFHNVAEALIIVGLQRQAVTFVKDYWGGMVKAGADTFWEAFYPDDCRGSPYGDVHNNSFCHAWSCTPSYLLRMEDLKESIR